MKTDSGLRQATIDDFVMPQYKGADPSKYEVRKDGVAVRKDRWENAVRSIQDDLVNMGLMPTGDFEIEDVVKAVSALAEPAHRYMKLASTHEPEHG